MKRVSFVTLCCAVTALLYSSDLAQAQVRGSRHDLTVGGAVAFASASPGSGGQGEGICIFCHTPHPAEGQVAMWNQRMPSRVYTPYSSSTLQSSPGQPTGDSKLCLSCHDGTIALGAALDRQLPVSPGRPLTGPARLGTDLSDDHPISFHYDAALAAEDTELAHPSDLPEQVRLDGSGQMQCTSCHDSHAGTFDNFLVMEAAYSALCITCHEKTDWSGSTHDTSPATWTGIGVDPWFHTDWRTVAANGCENCHSPHTSGSSEWLLNFPVEEENCFSCHSGEVARKDIAAEIRKPFRHAVDAYMGIHDPAEEFDLMPRHVECADCHNPHATIRGEATAPSASGPLRGVAGVNSSGARVEPADNEYEICFRCHADETTAPPPFIERQVLQLDIQLKTDPGNPSYHPIESRGRNNDVPSLLFPLNETSIIYCTDCHSNDTGPAAGGVGPSGPHGSNWRFLLEREYRIEDGLSESFQSYALCYKCHDRNSILADASFTKHREHIDESRTSCAVCHDPHGISLTQGDEINHSHLINFDTSIVFAEPVSGRLEFIDRGHRAGECWLECHGAVHEGTSYSR